MSKRKPKIIIKSTNEKEKSTVCLFCLKKFTKDNPAKLVSLQSNEDRHRYFVHRQCHLIMGEILGRKGSIIFKQYKKAIKIVREVSKP